MLDKIAGRISPGQFITPEMAQVFELLLHRRQAGEYIDLAQLSRDLPESTVALLSRILAQNYDIGFTDKDVEMYLSRVEDSMPRSVGAAEMSGEELEGYLRRLREQRR